MKAIVSTTYDDKYLFYLPICCWAWNKLGVDVVLFFPKVYIPCNDNRVERLSLAMGYIRSTTTMFETFHCSENKEATYAQCSRLFGGALNLPNDEILITSDIDMALYEIPPHSIIEDFTIFGSDLVPEKQYPMCYAAATKQDWANTFHVRNRTVQQCLDELLGDIDCDNMRGNYWGKDQETLYNHVSEGSVCLVNRAREGTQFATRRLDRDDAFLLERDMEGIVDYHMNRPGFDHIETIVEVFRRKYPEDNHQWMIDYANEYKKLI